MGTRMKEYAATPVERLGKLPPGIGVPIGEKAPDAVVHDFHGQEVRLSDLVSRGPILLVFYRGGWCPFCSFEIHELVRDYLEYRKRDVAPVAISVDRAEQSAQTQATYSIPFPVLSDPELVAHRAYHVLHRADDAEVATLKGYGMDLELASGQTHHTIAIPALFLISARGIVLWAHADPDYKVRPRTPQILAAIDQALGSSPTPAGASRDASGALR
jgi:peroxiredoxin